MKARQSRKIKEGRRAFEAQYQRGYSNFEQKFSEPMIFI